MTSKSTLTQKEIEELAKDLAGKAIRSGQFFLIQAASQYPDLLTGHNKFLFEVVAKYTDGVWRVIQVWTESDDPILVRKTAEVKAKLLLPIGSFTQVESVEIKRQLPTDYDEMVADLTLIFTSHFEPYFRNLFNQVWSSFRGRPKNEAIFTAWNAIYIFNNEIIDSFSKSAFGPALGWHISNFLVDYWNEIMVPLTEAAPGELKEAGQGTSWRFIASVDEKTCRTCLALHGTVVDGPEIQGKFPWAEQGREGVDANIHPSCRCNLTRVS